MTPVVKGAASASTVVIANGGFVVHELVLKDKSTEEEIKPVAIKTKGTTEGKIPFDFQMHFVDASSDTTNDQWRQKIFNEKLPAEKGSLSSQFAAATTWAGLKGACNTAYDMVIKTKIHPESDDADGSKGKYETDIWNSSSIEGTKSITVATEKRYYSSIHL